MIKKEEYEKALSRIAELMETVSVHNAEEVVELDQLVLDVGEYEDIHYPISEPEARKLKVYNEQARKILQKVKQWQAKKTKWKSRRLIIGAIWAIGFNFAFYWCASKGLSVEWFESYIGYFTLGTMFFGGFLTATDLLDRWKK